MLINVIKIETTKMKIKVDDSEFNDNSEVIRYVANAIKDVGLDSIVSDNSVVEQEVLVEGFPIEHWTE